MGTYGLPPMFSAWFQLMLVILSYEPTDKHDRACKDCFITLIYPELEGANKNEVQMAQKHILQYYSRKTMITPFYLMDLFDLERKVWASKKYYSMDDSSVNFYDFDISEPYEIFEKGRRKSAEKKQSSFAALPKDLIDDLGRALDLVTLNHSK